MEGVQIKWPHGFCGARCRCFAYIDVLQEIFPRPSFDFPPSTSHTQWALGILVNLSSCLHYGSMGVQGPLWADVISTCTCRRRFCCCPSEFLSKFVVNHVLTTKFAVEVSTWGKSSCKGSIGAHLPLCSCRRKCHQFRSFIGLQKSTPFISKIRWHLEGNCVITGIQVILPWLMD